MKPCSWERGSTMSDGLPRARSSWRFERKLAVAFTARAAPPKPLIERTESEMTEPAVRAAVEMLCRFAGERPGDRSDLARFLEDLFVGERGLLTSHLSGLVTGEEVIDALLDRFQTLTFGVPELGAEQRAAEWAVLGRDVYAVLFGRPRP